MEVGEKAFVMAGGAMAVNVAVAIPLDPLLVPPFVEETFPLVLL